MIPLRDKNPTQRAPIVTVALIVVNVAVFVYEVGLGGRLEHFFYAFGVVPADIVGSLASGTFNPGAIIALFTSMFLHGGWLHLGGNMLFLWIFGDNVEDKLGHFRFLVFYFLCGLVASTLHIFISPHSTTPTVGASGAISGVLGAYLFMFPRARVVTLIPIFIFIQIAELPALFVLGFWFVMQFFNGLLALGYETGGMGGVAWWEHIGGFVSGLILVIPFRRYR